MHDQRMKDPRARHNAQPLRRLRTCLFLSRQVHGGMMRMPARDNFFVNVTNDERRRHPVQLSGKSAHALHAINQTFQLQFAQRTVDGHAADPEMLHQLSFRRHQRARRPFTRGKTRLQVMLHLLEWGQRAGCANPRRAGCAYAVRGQTPR
jgi:RNase adaptor protein for sRNA GlmZ degradation